MAQAVKAQVLPSSAIAIICGAGLPPGVVSVRRSGGHATGRGRRCGVPALHRGALS
jgi:hypothetical protein